MDSKSRKTHRRIIINAGGYSHSSVAILDALQAGKLPVFEVHITNIYAREEFRHHSAVSKAAQSRHLRLGIDGYAYALQAAAKLQQLYPSH